jgi:hypothetical protein
MGGTCSKFGADFREGAVRLVRETALADHGQAAVTVSPSFWRHCSELRSAEIGRWLHRNGLAPWPPGRPPT